MSYSVSLVAPASEVYDAVDCAEVSYDHIEEVDEALEVAKDLVMTLIDSDVLGAPDYWGITISGHANPGHAPVAGWADDAITISVFQSNETNYKTYLKNLELNPQ